MMRLISIVTMTLVLTLVGSSYRTAVAQAKPASAKAQQDATPQGDEKPAAGQSEKAKPAAAPANPFRNRIPMLDFPPQAEWLNTKPLKLKDLRGKFVLIDFWTYCCINCIHVLPELKKLEHAYPNELVVIGCHSAKFETEKDTQNIAEAILRYEIEHPVFNDKNMFFWQSIGVRSWPTMLLIDPEGKAVWMQAGEVQFEQVDALLKAALPYYRHKKLLDETPLRFELLEYETEPTPLRFPGKVLADEEGGRLFISDTNHNRIVVTSLTGELQEIIGNGQIGKQDGGFDECSLHHPQGVALHGDTLYIADTENHMIRKADLRSKTVSTIAGLGVQSRNPWPGWSQFEGEKYLVAGKRWHGVPAKTELNSPWALWVHGDHLYIAMAGPHQIWWMDLDETAIGPFAGNGREDIVDGPHLPREPYALGASSFAQPSGLSSDGEWLFVADSEGSSIRAVPFDRKKPVATVVGTADLPSGRLFEFGDRNGTRGEVLLQHPLEVVYHDGAIYVADTYNDKIKRVDAKTGTTRTVTTKSDERQPLDEPTGLAYARGTLFVADTNNHRIRTIDLKSQRIATLEIPGLTPPKSPEPQKPAFDGQPTVLPAAHVTVQDGAVQLRLQLILPAAWKVNELAPQRYWITETGDADQIPGDAEGMKEVERPSDEILVTLPVKGESGATTVEILLPYFYCEKAGGLCKVGTVQWSLPLKWSGDGQPRAELEHRVQVFQFQR